MHGTAVPAADGRNNSLRSGGNEFRSSLGSDAAVSAAKIDERVAVEDFRAFDLTNENRVITRYVGRRDFARDVDKRIFQQWYAGLRPAITNSKLGFGLFVFFGLSKISRDGLLFLLQHIHAELPLLLQ